MKAITDALQDHLDSEVTTLTSLWKITRTDGVQYLFTEHDQDISFLGETYTSSSGYTRSAVSTDSSWGVDNIDVDGFVDAGYIPDTVIRAGLLDYAAVQIRVVNWADLSMGEIKLHSGQLGEIVQSSKGFFKTTLTGSSARLNQTVGELYSPECRADLGDHRCQVPLDPAVVARSTSYAVGAYVKVPTNTGIYDLGILNPGFETGDLTSWTLGSGTAVAQSGGAYNGTYYLKGTAGFSVHQTIDISASLHAAVDAGNMELDIGLWNIYGGRIIVQFLDGASGVLTTPWDTGIMDIVYTSVSPAWWRVYREGLIVPALARKVKITISGNNNDGFDGFAGTLRNKSTAYSRVSLNLSNPSFEIDSVGTPSGWTGTAGTWSYASHTTADEPDGTFSAKTASGAASMYQTHDVSSELNTADIDAGNYVFSFSAYQSTYNATGQRHRGRILVEFLTAGDAVISTAYDTGYQPSPNTTFVHRAKNNIPVPALTRKIKVTLAVLQDDSGTYYVHFDDITGFFQKGSSASYYDTYADRIYRCTVAGVTAAGVVDYTRVIGNTQVDGSASFICVESWTKAAVVSAVTDSQFFQIAVTDSRAVNDWFNYGVMAFETGDNAGRRMEVQNWVATGGHVEAFIQFPYDVQVGDKLTIYPGCDKRLATCKNVFANVINMRAEPYLPGIDSVLRYADPK